MIGRFSIGHRSIGSGSPVFVIAEAGVNHNGDNDTAKELVRQAKTSGADCVKFQTFKAERVVTADAPKAAYQLRVTDKRESQLEMLRSLELDEKFYGDLIEACTQNDILFSSTPYNEEDICFLDELDVPLLKAASLHLAEPRFLQRMAATGRPLIVSTGMATAEEIDVAVAAIRSTGNDRFVLLQCTTNYPSAIDDVNLRAMVAMRERWSCNVGYSDHTQSLYPCVGAVALGASVIEKHFTLDRYAPGPDHTTSETPESFAELVRGIRTIEVAMGRPEKLPTAAEQLNMVGMRRSIAARRPIVAGQVIGEDDLTFMRPATGILPREWAAVVGRTAARNVEAGVMLDWADVGV